MLGVISLGNANNTVTVTEDKLTVRANTDNSNEKTNVAESIFADLSGHKLTVAFSKNLGEVSIDISTASGATIFCLSVQTPRDTSTSFKMPAAMSSHSLYRMATNITENLK